jgi:predicted DNA-binding transcriptional regulator AlpA
VSKMIRDCTAAVNPSNAGIPPELLTLQQAAALCGVSDRTLWTWATDGLAPPPVRIGKGVVRYPRSVYLRWIEGGCQPLNDGGTPNAAV